MMALADKDGIVDASVPGLADVARVTVDECRSAREDLRAPDPDSRTKDFEGRRIRDVDGGWLLLNHRKYRDLLSDLDRREKNRRRVAAWRERQRNGGGEEGGELAGEDVTGCNVSVLDGDASNDTQKQKQKQTQKQKQKEGAAALEEQPAGQDSKAAMMAEAIAAQSAFRLLEAGEVAEALIAAMGLDVAANLTSGECWDVATSAAARAESSATEARRRQLLLWEAKNVRDNRRRARQRREVDAGDRSAEEAAKNKEAWAADVARLREQGADVEGFNGSDAR
jgi:hypothetical protein